MMRKTLLALAAIAVALPTAPALADPPPWAPAHGKRAKEGRQYGYAARPQYQYDNGVRYWRGDDGRNYCRRNDGTTGLLLGGVAGLLVGRAIDTRGDRTLGTVLGAAGGALLGREVERSSARCG
jgi:hypothetical protein